MSLGGFFQRRRTACKYTIRKKHMITEARVAQTRYSGADEDQISLLHYIKYVAAERTALTRLSSCASQGTSGLSLRDQDASLLQAVSPPIT
jgi:hypothetical protein